MSFLFFCLNSEAKQVSISTLKCIKHLDCLSDGMLCESNKCIKIRECDCDLRGSVDSQECGAETDFKCECKPGYTGDKCDYCSSDCWGFNKDHGCLSIHD